MSYSVNSLQTVADCNEAINTASKDKNALLAKQALLIVAKNRYTDNSVKVETEIPIVEAKIAYLVGILDGIPAGATRAQEEYNKRKEENKLYQLNTKKLNYGTLAMLDKEFELQRVAHEVVEADAFIAAINARKLELS